MTAGSGSSGRDQLPGLVAAAASGDAAALQSLLEGVWPDAYRIARGVLRDRHVAEDVAQEACARVIDTLPSLRRPEAFRLWFYRLVTHEAYRRVRQGARETPVAEMAEPEDRPGAAPTSAEILDLRRAIRALPRTYRLPVLLRYYFGLSDRETARVVGTTTGAVRVRLAVARRRLRHALREPPSPIVPPHVRGSQNVSQ